MEKTCVKHWKSIRKTLEKHCKSIRKALGKHWKNRALQKQMKSQTLSKGKGMAMPYKYMPNPTEETKNFMNFINHLKYIEILFKEN